MRAQLCGVNMREKMREYISGTTVTARPFARWMPPCASLWESSRRLGQHSTQPHHTRPTCSSLLRTETIVSPLSRAITPTTHTHTRHRRHSLLFSRLDFPTGAPLYCKRYIKPSRRGSRFPQSTPRSLSPSHSQLALRPHHSSFTHFSISRPFLQPAPSYSRLISTHHTKSNRSRSSVLYISRHRQHQKKSLSHCTTHVRRRRRHLSAFQCEGVWPT